MANLSYAQLKAVWLDAAAGTKYATNTWASLMAAIAEAESSGNPLAYNPTDNGGTQTSWGLWQISLGNHDAPAANWADPAENAKLAIGKLDGQGLSAWGTYDSGAYLAFLSDKTAADTSGIPSGPDAVETAATTSAAAGQSECLWPAKTTSLASLGPVNVNFPCLMTRSEARAAAGLGLLLAGFMIAGGGVVLILISAGIRGAPLAAAAAVPEAGAVAGAARTAAPARGTVADDKGTSPEFRRMFLGGDK